MPFIIQSIRETPSGPRAEIFPSCTYGYVEVIVGAAGNAYIYKGTNVFPVSAQWNLPPRSVLSFTIRPGLWPGGALQIDLSHDGTVYYPALNFHLIGLQLNSLSGIELPGFAARFILYNAAPADQTFEGSIILKGV